MHWLDRTHWMLLDALKSGGSISEAAILLNITQPAASQRLAEAERRLGVKLAVKRGRTLELTEAGKTIAKAASIAKPQLLSAEAEAIWQGKRASSRLSVAWSAFDPPKLANALMRLSSTLEPPMDIEFIRTQGDQPITALSNKSAQLILLPGALNSPAVTSLQLCHDRLVAVVAKDSPLAALNKITPTDMAGLRFLTYGLRPEEGWEYDHFFDRGRNFPAVVSKIESTELICQLVGDDWGVSILPTLCVQLSAYREQLKTIELDIDAITFYWYAHYLQGGEGAEAAGEIAERLRVDMLGDLEVYRF